MTERYLRLTDHFLTPVLMILAIFLLLRGHNQPGGGFIAGLVVAAVLQLQIMSRGDEAVRNSLGPYLHPMMGVGLLMAAISASIGILYGTFFSGIWWHVPLGSLEFDIGTPVTFDIGVFLVVVSVVTSYLLGLSPRESDTRT